MVKSDLKLNTYIKNKHTGQVYIITKIIRNSNKRCSWNRYAVKKLNSKNILLTFYFNHKEIKRQFTVDKTAHILYSK